MIDRFRDGLRRLLRDPASLLRTHVFKLISAYFSSNMLAMGVQAVSGLLVARIAGPDNMGIILTVGMIIPLLDFTLLATPNGLNRQLPLLIGQGKRDEAQALADTAWFWTRNVGILIGVGLLFTAFYTIGWMDKRQLGEAWLVYALIIPIQLCIKLFIITYRTSGDFIMLSKIKVVMSGITLVSILLLLIDPWYGLLARAGLSAAINYFIMRRFSPIKMRSIFSRVHFFRLITIGFPIFGVGYLASLFGVFDRTMIIKFFGVEEMGMYVPAMQIMVALGVFSGSINTVIYPRMCMRYGETGSSRSLARLAFLPPLILSIVLLPIYAFGWWFVDPFVHWVLPDYAAGISAARWIVVASYFGPLSSPLSVFHTIYKLAPYAIFIVVGIGMMIGASFFAVKVLDWGIEGVAFGRAAGMITFVIMSIIMSAYYIFIKEVRIKEA